MSNNNGNSSAAMTSSATNVSMTASQPMASRPSSEPLRDTMISGNTPPSASKSFGKFFNIQMTELFIIII